MRRRVLVGTAPATMDGEGSGKHFGTTPPQKREPDR
jgi:hypothetical protein